MIETPLKLDIPLRMDEGGALRVGGTRVTLDTVIACYHQGDTPEVIQESFDALSLDEVYAVIAYYLANREAMDIYLAARDADAERVRREVEANYTPEQRATQERLRTLLAARRAERKD